MAVQVQSPDVGQLPLTGNETHEELVMRVAELQELLRIAVEDIGRVRDEINTHHP